MAPQKSLFFPPSAEGKAVNAQNPAAVLISAHPFDPYEEMRIFRKRFNKSGGIASFLGQVRDGNAGAPVQKLRLEHYPGFTERMIEGFARDAFELWPLEGLRIVHRVGDLTPGDPIVFGGRCGGASPRGV